MRNTWIALTLALALPVAGFAQSTDTNDAATDTDAPSIEDQLSLGEDANANPQVGQTYTAEKIGDWELRCIKVQEGEDPCQMYQLLTDNAGTPVAEVSIFRLPEGGRAVAGATIIVPLETALQQQLLIQVDAGETRRYPYAFCNQIGCYARVGLVADEVAAFRAGNAATVTIIPALAQDQPVRLTMSLNGFTASYNKTSIAEN